jgi:Uma2 family endonuclease
MNAVLPLQSLKPHKLTVDDLLTLERGGAFDGLPRMELLDGTLYEMSPQSSPHVRARNRLTFRLQCRIVELALPFEAFSEATIKIGSNHAPEPDVVISKTPEVDGYYPSSCILLAVEVAVTSMQTDMGYKKPLYAAAAIPEYWIVDVDAAQIIQFWSPEGEDYRETRTIPFGDMIECATIPDLMISTTGLI